MVWRIFRRLLGYLLEEAGKSPLKRSHKLLPEMAFYTPGFCLLPATMKKG
jgi:hypothetical protein